jgi:hypothetical protein
MDAGSHPSQAIEGTIMVEHRRVLRVAIAAGTAAVVVSGCGDSGGTPDAQIGGTVSGLPAAATVQLADNSTDVLSVTANGGFEFAAAVAAGSNYDVTVGAQPAGATCSVSNAIGTVDSNGDPVTNVAVSCTPGAMVGGTLSGLAAGASLTLADATTTLQLAANGAFQFSDLYLAEATYSVTVAAQPSGQVCSVTNGSGTIDAGGDGITNIAVSCVTGASLGGTVAGLAAAQTVTLSDGTSNAVVTTNGAFGFGDAFAAAAPYQVSVATQPTGQMCTVGNSSGTIDMNDDSVTTVAVVCESDGTVGGTVSGLSAGNTLMLSDGVSTLSVSANGNLAFSDVFAAGAPYAISVTSQPTGQTCSIANGNGTFDATDDPVLVTVTCM